MNSEYVQETLELLLAQDSWSHIVLMRQRDSTSSMTGKAICYCNGQQIFNINGAGFLFSFWERLTVNAKNTKLDHLRIYDRALSGAEISKLYNNGQGV